MASPELEAFAAEFSGQLRDIIEKHGVEGASIVFGAATAMAIQNGWSHFFSGDYLDAFAAGLVKLENDGVGSNELTAWARARVGEGH